LIEVTPQEQQLISSLVERVNKTQLQEKDPDAEALLTQGLSSNPDALYILAQSVLIQNFALDQAKAQVAQLEQQLQQARQPARATSFLGNLLGHRDPAPPPYTPVQQTYVPPPPPPPGYVDPQYAQPQYIPTGQPSFLRGAMQTAAGVAAGALAFEGVESLLHGGFGHSEFGMGSGMGPGMGMMGGGFERPEETVINNYYDQPGGQEHHAEQGSFNQGDQAEHFHETSDQGGAQFSDASYNTSGDDRANLDDNVGFDDGNVDDNIAQDDGGGFDDGGGIDSGGGGDFS
jgi:hypothetical protein